MAAQEKRALLRSRVSARSWLTISSRKLEELCSKDRNDVSILELNDAVAEFDERLRHLDDTQNSVEQFLDDEELDGDIQNSADFREKSKGPRLDAAKLSVSMNTESEGAVGVGSSLSESRSNSGHINATLPKLELPIFSGDVSSWLSFWEQFSAVVDASNMPDITKFSYLQSLLKGEAKAAIQGLSLTAANYHTACDVLKKRFGRPERIIFSHIQDLLSIDISPHPDVKELWTLLNDLQVHIRSLENLKISGNQYGVILTPLILSRLPSDLRLEWAREGEGHEGDLEFLMEFLRREVQRRERSEALIGEATSDASETMPRATAAALHSSSERDTRQACEHCKRKGHRLYQCFQLKRVPVCERKEKLKRVGACFRCLSTAETHLFKKCQALCSKCRGKHHSLLCDPKCNSPKQADNQASNAHVQAQNTDESTQVKINVSSVNACTDKSTHVLLQTLQLSVKGNCGETKAVVLFDTGSDKSYISKDLVNKIGPQWVGSQNLAYATFGSAHSSCAEERNVYEVLLQGGGNAVKLNATEISTVCVPVCQPSVPESVLSALGGDFEQVSVLQGQKVKVDVLIGLDAYWKLMTGEMKFLSQDLVAQKSVFGWVLSGCVPVAKTDGFSQVNVSHQLFCAGIPEESLKTFWDLESIGISDKQVPVVDPVLSEFNKEVQFVEGRYMVSLPWKSEEAKQSLLDNEDLARARLGSLDRRFSKDPDLGGRYHSVFCEMMREGVIEEVPVEELNGSHPVFYLPHHPVVKESSLTTKVRPVFDASAKGRNGVSLNDCMNTGPSFIPDLPGILMRFRRWKVALIADVTKAFLQIRVRQEDQDVHRFLWNDKGVIRVMRFSRVPFGNKSSPFLLNATVKYHLAQCEHSLVNDELSENLYMDDWLSGCDDESEACGMLKGAHEIMAKAGMSLAKWSSNSEQVSEMLQRDFQDKTVNAEAVKVLGMQWVPSKDCFMFEGMAVSGDICITKRIVLSLISRLFDPLGFLTPFIMMAKCLFQQVWRLGLHWDAILPEELRIIFSKWIKGLQVLKGWGISRRYTEVGWREISSCELHAFGDASQQAYGACVFLVSKTPGGVLSSTLVLARARVAPLKRVSLPRLELLGALLCARMMTYVKRMLKLPDEIKCHCWTDSTVALAWIQSDPNRWKPFVGNRVSEIQELVSPTQWKHCPGKDNPADLVTRGISAEELMDSQLWIRGPLFLTNGSESTVSGESHDTVHSVMINEDGSQDGQHMLISVAVNETKTEDPVTEFTDPVSKDVIDVGRFSTFQRVLRVMGYVLRFVHNLRCPKGKRMEGDLCYSELSEAKLCLLRQTQNVYGCEKKALRQGESVPHCSSISKLSPFMGEDGLLRVKGRLQFTDLPAEVQHPIIVPKGHLSTLLVRHAHVNMKHAGVNSMLVDLRNQYWILGARRTCKQVKKECVSCQYLDASPCVQTMAPLPEMRVKQAPPFSVTGLDHGGPLYCCDFAGVKFYVLLFTCAVVRAVHLELVNSLSCEATILALRRFFARRGTPSLLMSDNAKGFLAARTQLMKSMGSEAPDWKFIAPRAPWWGGWWERLIGIMKSSLKRSLGKRLLTRQELETVLHEVEACMNSRPLTFVGDELDSGSPLTPSHFLLGGSPHLKQNLNSEDMSVTQEDLIQKNKLCCHISDQFWVRWIDEYIKNLRTSVAQPASKKCVQVGSVVLVRGEGTNRLQWPLGVVQAVYPGRDGLVRTVEVKTAKGKFVRPIQRIYSLELVN